METFKRYRVFYIDAKGAQVYLRKGKFYKTISACKQCITRENWRIPIGEEREYFIEEYALVLTEQIQKAKIKRLSSYKFNKDYKEIEYYD